MVVPSVASSLTTYTYAVVSVCSYKIWKKLKSQHPIMRPRTVSLQVQLNRMLLVQVILAVAELNVLSRAGAVSNFHV